MIDKSGLVMMGVVGSTAYGLDRPGSDEDRIGVFVRPTIDFLGLTPPSIHDTRQTKTSSEPDTTIHELGKFLFLALKCNPTVTELMWLPEYEHLDGEVGAWLVEHRTAFLSREFVRTAYLGYAESQFDRLIRRGDGTYSSDTKHRTAKNSRHILRLLHQGRGLWNTGELVIRLEDPQVYFDFGERVEAGDLSVVRKVLDEAEEHFETNTLLPEYPRTDEIEDFLIEARRQRMPARPYAA